MRIIGSGGIGAEIVKKLAGKGTRIAVIDLLPLTFDAPDCVKYYKANIADEEDFRKVAESIRADFGKPTVLVANAAIVRPGRLLDSSSRDTELTFRVNNIGLVRTYKEFVPAMVAANHGHILTTASTASFLAVPGMIDYSETKAATIALHEGFRAELKVYHGAPAVRTTLVCPSTANTAMFKGFKGSSAFLIPVKEPSYIAGLVVDAIWAGESRQIVVPTFQSWNCAWARAFPASYRIEKHDGNI